MPYGVTPTGFWAKPLQTVETEIDLGLRQILGDDAGTDSDGSIPVDTMAGQLKALLVDGFSAQWDLQQAVYASLDPNKAAGVFLDAIGSLTGSQREAARHSVATGLCIGTPLTTLPVGRVATVAGTASRFDTATGINLATGTPYTASGSYLVGDLRFIAGQNRTYLCVATGIGSASGPSGTAASITAGGTTWQYLGEGVGYAPVAFVAEAFGAIGVATGSLNTIVTPVSGWNAVYNLLAGVAGSLAEVDSVFRARRASELAAAGNTTADAIRANILALNEGSTDPNHQPPTACTVFHNDADFTDSNGVPPHSIEVLVKDGTDADIAQTIWNSVGAGTRTYGSTSATVLDSQGSAQVVYYTRPTQVPIYVYTVGRYDASQWPSGSEAVVAQAMLSALLTYTADYPVGLDVRTSPLNAAMMRGPAGTTGGLAIVPADADSDPVVGLLEIESLSISIASGVTGTAQISIPARSIAVFDSTRCFVTASTEDL